MPDQSADHWKRAYAERQIGDLSWTEAAPTLSLELIAQSRLASDAAIIDVGGGASRLAAELLRLGHSDITVADISGEALDTAKADLGENADRVTWIEADVRVDDFGRRFDLWHDRAVFHFMVDAADRDGYLGNLRRALRPAGHLIFATFGPEGPTQCSGLPVERYDAKTLSQSLGEEFELVSSQLKEHRTPSGRSQQFLYAHMRRLRA
jgi:SAM-dependent methyltransferase